MHAYAADQAQRRAPDLGTPLGANDGTWHARLRLVVRLTSLMTDMQHGVKLSRRIGRANRMFAGRFSAG
jgi:hypothetical protein